MAELEPCPFCKGEAVMVRQRKKGRTRDIVNAFARCTFCGARSRNVSTLHVAERNLETYAARAWNARWERTCHVLPYAPDYSQGAFDKDGRCSERGHIGYFKSGNYKHCPDCGAEVADE